MKASKHVYVPSVLLFLINSLQTSPECRHVHKDNRDKEKFICTNCGYFRHADLNAAEILKQRGVNELGLTLSCRVKRKKVREDFSKPQQLTLLNMPIPESTGVRRRSAPQSQKEGAWELLHKHW